MGFYWLSSLKNKNKTNEQKKMDAKFHSKRICCILSREKGGQESLFPKYTSIGVV